MLRQYELVERVKSYDPDADEDAINRAYVFSVKAHGAQQRASGDPYFAHPVEVAGILTKYRLDSASIVTALLHDTVEDTGTTLEQIERGFGGEVAKLVDGVTKLSRLEMQALAERSGRDGKSGAEFDGVRKQAENLRKFLLAISGDLRVLLVKLADRLHNMRTLRFIKEAEKRKRIARETLDIYAPLAERIGMRDFQEELLDLAFAELNPDGRDSILKRLDFLREKGGDIQETIRTALYYLMQQDGIEAEITGREKKPYSIWSKMQQKDVEFEQLSDIMAFRVVVKDVAACYAALGAIHAKYRVVPGRFKDYISLPKPNGYRSLHTGVFGPGGHRIEVQIRTKEMHAIAEYGLAAHWQYKQNVASADTAQYRWLKGLLDIIEQAQEPEEFLEHTKLEMFQDRVFCFTPGGDLIELPRNATAVDFAYAVHSEVGDRCVGVKINGRMAQLRTALKNGDQVEIITSKAQTPSPEWLPFVVSGKARARIRRFVRQRQRSEHLELGEAILEKAFRERGLAFTTKALEPVTRQFGAGNAEELILAVGEGNVHGRNVVAAIVPPEPSPEALLEPKAKAKRKRKAGQEYDHSIDIRGLTRGMAVHFAGCCHPLPGERIVGIVTTGKGVTIHTIDCESLEQFPAERWLDVAWNEGADEELRIGRLHATVTNEPGALGTITTVIGKHGGNINNLRFTNRQTDFFEMLIDVQVRDIRHLSNIIAALRATGAIASVARARG